MTDNAATIQLYLDDIGITKAIVEAINHTHGSSQDLIESKLDFATTVLSRKVLASKQRQLAANGLLESERVGYKTRSITSESAKTGYNAGVMIETRNDRDFTKIYVSGISLFAQSTGNVSVGIYDMRTGLLLDTVVIAAVAGQQVYKDVDKTYRSDKQALSLGFVYDSTFASYRATVRDNDCSTCGGLRKNVGRYVYAQGIKIPTASSVVIDNITSVADTSGLSITYQVQCDYDQWICRGKNYLLLSALYATGYELAMYGLNSPRNNSRTIDYRERLTQIKDFCEAKMNEELNTALNAMIVPDDNHCFYCRRASRHATTL